MTLRTLLCAGLLALASQASAAAIAAPKTEPAKPAAAKASGGGISREALRQALEKNPDLIINALRKDKKTLFQLVNEAAREEQMRAQAEEQEAERREIESSFKDPKVAAIDDKSPMRGPKDAKYTLIEYSDFQCPYCTRGFHTVETLIKKYGNDLRFVYKHLPLSFHPLAMPAAQWFEAVALQSKDKAWQFHDALYQNQDKLSEAFLKETAKGLGVDMAKAEKDAQSQEVKDRIEADVVEAKKFGFSGTPGFLMNGVPVRGAYPAEHFDGIIQKLEAAKAATPAPEKAPAPATKPK